MVQLSALLGLIPLQYYVYLLPNFNMTGGPMTFLINDMKWNQADAESNYKEELQHLQQIYSSNLTSNIFENTSCIIGRKLKKKDVFYHFPLFDEDLNLIHTQTQIQFVFRVKVLDVRNMSLICKPSTTAKEFVVFDASSSSSKIQSIMFFNRTTDENNLNIFSKDKHEFDTKLILNHLQQKRDETSTILQHMQGMSLNTLPSYEKFYNHDQQIVGYDKWNQFSVIHSTPGYKFNFVAYNCSHRLKNEEEVDPYSKIVIKFPENSSYFIVFHGRLVHNGDKSIIEEDNSVKLAVRLFSYLNVPLHNVMSNSRRTSKRLRNYTSNIKEGTVDTSSFKFDVNSRISNEDSHIVELPEYDVDKSNNSNLIPVAGNMTEFGWEVYRGVEFDNRKIKKFKNDCNKLIKLHGSKFNKINQTERSSYDMATLESQMNKSISSLRSIYQTFNDMQHSFLRKIPYLDEVELHRKLVLCNMAYVEEQIPHRDYSSIKK